jgi:c(7)-type cytochrome triheme protein
MCSSQKRKTTRSERERLLYALICAVFFLAGSGPGLAQIYLPQPPPEQPSDYGKVIIGKTSSTTGPGPVVFDHWLHRAKFTCRLCHVDIGFAMQANATGITATTNRQGFHCGACHDGKRVIDKKTVFASCSENTNSKDCNRCHSLGKKDVRKYTYKAYTAKLPKGLYGVDWRIAEGKGKIKPIDFLEGISVKKTPILTRPDFSIKAALPWVHPIVFSHERHAIWNGCELCHPEIFPTAPKETVRDSMFLNTEGRYCGACHGRVAFPLNNCNTCHANAPTWVR